MCVYPSKEVAGEEGWWREGGREGEGGVVVGSHPFKKT